MYHSSPENHSARVIHGEYYPHIDGIRTLAVMPVVLFHILACLCPGGFAGVDVFFVISGYLITGGIIRDLEKDRFTIRNFYYRRIRRIMPAYFAMIAGVFAVGCVLYYAKSLIFLGDAVVAGTLFLANFHFWMLDGNYFAPQLHSQALLHLWSLSVEEQFYLFIPLLCAIVWKFNRRLVAPVLSLLTILSLTSAIYAVKHGQQNSAFYFLHYRAWELLAGSLLAMFPAAGHSLNPQAALFKNSFLQKCPTLLAPLGLLLVTLTYVFITSKTPFPGLTALPPVIGTALLIRYGQSGWVSRLLSCRPFVATGKISYSLYLWHWPVTVFWKYAVYDQLYAYDYLGMLILSALLAYLSWKFIEMPMRISTALTMSRAFLFAGVGIALLVGLGTACVHYKGWPDALHPKANEWAGPSRPQTPFLTRRIHGFIHRFEILIGRDYSGLQKHTPMSAMWQDGYSSIGASGHPRVLLIGDSHASSLRSGLDTLLRQKNLAGYSICRSATHMFDLQLPESQLALNKLRELKQVSSVILAERWLREKLNESANYERTYVKLEEYARHLGDNKIQLFILTDIPNYDYPLNEIVARMQIIKPRHMETEWVQLQQSEMEYNRVQGEGINTRLKEICQRTGALLIPLHLSLKDNNHYIVFDRQNGKIVPLYRDTDHLSQAGSLRAAQFMMPYLFPDTVLKN